MTDSKTIQVIGAGSPIVDLLIHVSDEFIETLDGGKGGMELVSPVLLEEILTSSGESPEKAPGGSAANTIFGLTHLGSKTSLIGKIGRDAEGEFYRNHFVSCGGNADSFKFSSDAPTGRCLSMITPDSERTMRTDLGAAATLSPEDIRDTDFVENALVHIEGYLLFNESLIRKVIQTAKAKSCRISLDLASFEVVRAAQAVLPELLQNVDIIFANEDEAEMFCGSDKPEDALAELNRFCEIAAVKVGSKGAFIKKTGEGVIQVPTEPVKAVDTTGAGDLWQAGFLYGLINGRPLRVCARFGNVLGGEVVQIIGASMAEDQWERIRNTLNQIED